MAVGSVRVAAGCRETHAAGFGCTVPGLASRLSSPPSEAQQDGEAADAVWDGFVEIYSQQRRSIFHPWPYLKTVFGLAALGAAGVTIGALFNQK
ncbi:hypothetical protein NFI96_017254 [Prochilodus magdalenae]|nr:hypothetical protein NFI96_017254 [Prochilodus magdalenae]